MLKIRNEIIYKQHYEIRKRGILSNLSELLLSMLLFGSIGAITWAIRGTAGWGGVDGTIVPGFTWALLWYYLANRKGIDSRSSVLWLGLGIALGGELGYGQYVAWIRGTFYIGDGTVTIDPWLGYLWFIICGIGWASPGSILLGWSLGKNISKARWIGRSLYVCVLLVILFAWPLIESVGEFLLNNNITFLFPNADIYTSDLGKHISRTVYTNTQNFAVVLWWGIALVMAVWQRDKITLITGLLIGVGFGLGFMQSALWTLGYEFAPNYIDWWKMWELNSGFNLGVLYSITLYWAIGKTDYDNQSSFIKDATERQKKDSEVTNSRLLAFGGFALLFFVGFEYFFWTGLTLSVFYFISIYLTGTGKNNSNRISERRKNVTLIYSVYFLLFILLHGASERLGIVLELYSLDEVSQYSWPLERILLFVPVAVIISCIAVYYIRKELHKDFRENLFYHVDPIVSFYFIDLITFIGFIGVLTIWPAKISIIYAAFVVIAVFAFNRLNYKYDQLENNI